jgi:hypothetical protein
MGKQVAAGFYQSQHSRYAFKIEQAGLKTARLTYTSREVLFE